MKTLLICCLILVALVLNVEGHGLVDGIQKIHTAKEIRRINFLRKFNANKEPVRRERFWAANYVDDYISTNISVGNPEQKFNVAIETSTRNLWVFGSSSSSGQNAYDPKKSKTSKTGQGVFDSYSGACSIKGEFVSDKVKLLNAQEEFVQKFGMVATMDCPGAKQLNSKFPLDGALGLAWDKSQIAQGSTAAPVVNLLHPCDKRWITIWLGQHYPPSSGKQSKFQITLGNTDNKNCDHGLKFMPLGVYDATGFSTLTFQIDSLAYSTYKGQVNAPAIVDTGFPIIQMEMDQYSTLYKMINPQYDFSLMLLTVPCSSAPSLSDIIFTIGGKTFAVPSKNYVVDLEIGNGNCALAIGQNDPDLLPVFALGNPFLRSFCVVYNVDRTAVAFPSAIGKS